MYCQNCGKKLDNGEVCNCLEANENEVTQTLLSDEGQEVAVKKDVPPPAAEEVVEVSAQEPANDAVPPPSFNTPQPENFGGQSFNSAPPPQPQNFGGQSFNSAPPPQPQNFGGQSFNSTPPPPPQNFGGQNYNSAPPPPPQNFGGQTYNSAPPPPPQNFGGQNFNSAPPPPPQNVGGQSYNSAPPPVQPQNFNGGYNNAAPPPMPNYGTANGYAPQMPVAQNTKAITKLRAAATSPITLAAVITLVITTGMAIIALFTPASELDMMLGNSGIDPMAVLVGLIGLTPQILVLIGLIIFVMTCMDKTGAPIKTTGLTMIKVGGMIWSIAMAVVLILCGIILMAASSMIGSFMGFFGSAFAAAGLENIFEGESASVVIILTGLVCLILGVLVIFAAVGLLKTMNAFKSIAITGSRTYGSVSMMLVAMLFIAAILPIASIIMMFVNPMTQLMGIDYMALVLNILLVIEFAAFGVALINAKNIK